MGCIGGRCGRRWRRRCRRRSVRRWAGRRRSWVAYRALIDAWLEADREAPRKQRHTARRIWRRLVDEHGADVAETTVRQYVRERQRELGWPVAEVFVPQVHAPGPGGRGRLGPGRGRCSRGAPATVHVFVMRACVLGRGVLPGVAGRDPAGVPGAARAGVRVVRRRVRGDPLRQPDLGGQEGAQGPPAGRDRSVRRDALALPVRVAVHDRRASRARTRRAVSRARSAASAATTSSRSRRSRDLAELNALLLAGCEQDLGRRIDGRAGTVGEALGQRAAAAARAARRAVRRGRDGDAARRQPSRWSRSARTATRSRSRWPACGSARASARARSRSATAASEVARHERLHGRFGTSAQLDHYLELLAAQARRRWSARSRSPRSATAAPGPAASTSCGRR